jgi:uncharacterized protein YecE (DUF72 family)
MKFLVGTSGWSYSHWKGVFYPQDLPQSKWFGFYAQRFGTVEVNATFYRTFKDETYRKWYENAPESFRYVLKTPRFITHRKYLVDAGESIKRFCESASLLKEKFGMFLLQLAPGTPYDPDRLKTALQAFENPGKVAVEFRHKRWLTEETRQLLRELGAVFCVVDAPKTELLDWVTSDSAYIRLHGREHWYSYDYSTRELHEIADLAKRMAESGANRVYVFFNNDLDGYAPKNALELMGMLGE